MAPITYIEKFVDNPDGAFLALKNELKWERRGDAPRSEYYCNDFPLQYIYGKGKGRRTYEPSPYHPIILEIRKKLEETVGSKFEVCFLNMYLNQKDSLNWHADDSPEMDDARPIATISLGAEREIWFVEQSLIKTATPERVKLAHGSCCVMAPGMQDTHFHRIPKASFNCGERISLTFRGYVKNDF